MSKIKRMLALVLTLCMLLSAGGHPVFAVENTNPSTAVQDYFYKIVHLDAARKYFSVDNIKDIIDVSAEAGYNQLELYLSDNQGFRLGLDDMTVTTEFGTYDMTPALGAGYSQDPHYTDGKEIWLTQQEMDEIIAYANQKGMDVVPCINAPGHMGALLEAFPEFRYSTTINGTAAVSKSALNLWNEEAYAFGLAFIEKYAEYFKSRGVKVFNFGADEYGCDLMTNSGTGENNGMDIVYNNGGYDEFVDFINDEIALLKDMGLQPRAFSDCIYYTGTNVYNGETLSIDTDLEICYWNGGWYWSSWFRRADADYLADMGFRMINTNGDYYHILGGTLCTPEKASQFDYQYFHSFNPSKNIYLTDVAGAMFCIWCDDARDTTCTSDAAVAGVLDTITAFGGTLPTPATASVTHSGTGITVSAPGLVAVEAAEADKPTMDGIYESTAYSIAPATAFGSYYGNLNVSIPVPADYAQSRTKAALFNGDSAEPVYVDGTIQNGNFVFSFVYDAAKAPVVVLYEVPCTEKQIEVAVNESVQIITDTDLSGDYAVEDPAIADVAVDVTVTDATTVPSANKVTSLSSGEYYLYNGINYLVVKDGAFARVSEAEATPWTATVSSSGTCNFKQGSYYLSNSYSTSSGYVFKALTSTPYVSWSYNASGIYAYIYGENYYVYYNTNGWIGGDASNSYPHYMAYEVDEVPATVESVITFTGKAAGTTSVEIGDTNYIIHVTGTEETEPEPTEPEVTEPDPTEPEVTEPEPTEPEVTEPEPTEPEVTEPEPVEEFTFWLTHYNTIANEGSGAVMTSSYSGGAWNLHVSFAPCDEENVYEIVAISDGTEKGAGSALSIPSGGFVYSLNQGNDWPSLYAANPSAYSWYANTPDYTSDACNAMLERALEWSVGDRFVINGLDLDGKTVPTSTSSLNWYADSYVCTATYYAYTETEVEPETPEVEPETPTEPVSGGITVAYVPLDNRPVNIDRVIYLAGASGFNLEMPAEEDYATVVDGANSHGGNPQNLLNWLKEQEAAGVDHYIISLDQMFSGGLCSSRVTSELTASANGGYLEYEIADYMVELAKDNYVVFFDTVLRLAPGTSYQNFSLDQYNALRSYGSQLRKVLSGDDLTIDNIVAGYPYGQTGSVISKTYTYLDYTDYEWKTTTVDEDVLQTHLAARERKLRLIDYVIRNVGSNADHLYIGVDDSSANENIQYNEREYIHKIAAEYGVNYQLFAGADELGLMGIAALASDYYGKVNANVTYFGSGADMDPADNYDYQSLRTTMNLHLEAIGVNVLPTYDATALQILVLTQDTDCSTYAAELVAQLRSNLEAGIPTCVLDCSNAGANNSRTLSDHILGYSWNTYGSYNLAETLSISCWNTVANTIGIGLSNAVGRYAYIYNSEEVTAESNVAFVKTLTFALVKDISYRAHTYGNDSSNTSYNMYGRFNFDNSAWDDVVRILEKLNANNTILGKDGQKVTYGTISIDEDSVVWTWGRDFECRFEIVVAE